MVKVAIDAGHGMGSRKAGVFDPGAVGELEDRTLQEASIALHYALTLKYVLTRNGYGVFMTRTDNHTDAPLSQRVTRAREAGCTMLISIHLNSSAGENATGIETLYRTETHQRFAQALHDATLQAFPALSNRGLKKRDRLAILQFTPYACLIELGFIRNTHDMAHIYPRDDALYRNARLRWAESIAQAIKRFAP